MHTDPVVILTREPRDNRVLAGPLTAEGFRVIEYPCIAINITPYREGSPIDGMPLQEFPVVVFTSRRGVSGMKEVFRQLSGSGQLLAVVGDSTAAAVKEYIGRDPGVVANPPTGEALAGALVAGLDNSQRILHVRGNKSTGDFKRIMEAGGFKITELIVYQNEMPQLQPLAVPGDGIVLFASPSAAACFFQYNTSLTGKLDYLAIGPATAGYLKKQGIKRVFEAPSPDPNGLVNEIKHIFNKNKKTFAASKGGYQDEK